MKQTPTMTLLLDGLSLGKLSADWFFIISKPTLALHYMGVWNHPDNLRRTLMMPITISITMFLLTDGEGGQPVPNGWRVGSCPTPLTPMLNIRDKIPWPIWKLQNQIKHIKITYRVYSSWNLLILSRHPSILNRIHRYICKDRVKLIADKVH